MIETILPELLALAATGIIIGTLVNLGADCLPRRSPLTRPANRTELIHAGLHAAWATPRHRITILASICLTVLAWLRFTSTAQFLIAVIYSAILALVLIIDLEHRLVLNIVLAPTALGVLLLGWLLPELSLRSMAIGSLIGLVLFLIIAVVGRGAMGAGDVKLAGLIGLIMGYPLALKALLLGIILGGVGTLLLLLSRRVRLGSYIPYAPWLVGGTLLVMFMDPRFFTVIGG